MSKHPLSEDFALMFDGYPVNVRLTTGQDILAVVYYSEEEHRVMLERPVAMQFEFTKDSEPLPENFQLTRLRTRFDRWILLSDAEYYPVYVENILTMAPLTELAAESYLQWAEKLYETPTVLRETPASSSSNSLARPSSSDLLPDGSTREEVINSYLDFFLHNFKPKGKPN